MDLAYTVSQAVWFAIQPGNLLIFVLLVGTLSAWLRPGRSGRLWLTLLTAVLLFVTVAPVAEWIARPLEARIPRPAALPARVDGILVLGGILQRPVAEEWGALAVNDSAERLMVPAALALQHPEARLVITGHGEDHEVLASWFSRIGLDAKRIAYEPAARNTFENAVRSQGLVRPGPQEVWLLVTSAQHMPRAVGVFRKIGWPVVPYPVDYRTGGAEAGEILWTWSDPAANLSAIGVVLKEWVGLLAYYLLDRSDELFPAPRDP